MKRAILRHHGKESDWSCWRVVILLAEYENSWLIWSWREPFGRYIHKRSLGVRVESL
jgi:hypothetical protein